jgi:crotonobetainyl-CoA:carnitine CoA-transferase CaiB-like acyl-CoA transferase
MAIADDGPLAGLRVLDLGRVLAAPWASQILGDLGADVIKVERPGSGDDARSLGNIPVRPDGGPAPAAMFFVANRNKRSIEIDITRPEGAELVRAMALKSDILIENFLPGKLARFGLDHATLREAHPGLIYCSVTGYGQDGPYKDRPGYDGLFQAVGGLMSVTGNEDGSPGDGPMKSGPSLVDVATGYVAVIGILAALQHRNRTGEGQHVDATLLDAVVSLQSSLAQSYLISRKVPKRTGSAGNGGHPAGMFHCGDGPVFISAGGNAHYKALCRVLDLPQLADDPRFATNQKRFANRHAWTAIAAPALLKWQRADLVDALVAADVPCGPVADYDALFSDPHVTARDVTVAVANPLEPDTDLATLASPVRLSATPATYRRRPPNLGEHTDEILTELFDFSAEDLRRYREAGVLGVSRAGADETSA